MSLSCLFHVKRDKESQSRPPPPTIYTDVVWCGDRSGSMSSMGGSPEEGAENFMKEHKLNAEKMNNLNGYYIEFTTFDNDSTIIYSKDACEMTEADIANAKNGMIPRGSTKFYDTAIECLKRQRERIDFIKNNLTPQQKELYYENSHLINAVFATFTDGYDNSSIADAETLKKFVKEQENDYGVVCMFLAANISAEECGEQFGFQSDYCMQMGSDRQSSGNALRSCTAAMTRAVTQSRTASGFTQFEREISSGIINNTNVTFVTPPTMTRQPNRYGMLRQPAFNFQTQASPPIVPAVPVNTPDVSPLSIPTITPAAAAAIADAFRL